MDARYRTDYLGEFVILETKWSGGKKSETREWIDIPLPIIILVDVRLVLAAP